MSSALHHSQASDIAQAVASGRSSASSIVDACLADIGHRDATLGAFTAVVADRARKRASSIDARLRRGETVGPLAGVPFAVKNLFDIAGLPTVAGSKINQGHAAATQDAALVQRLEAAGAILVGALNMGEYAYDFTGENSHFGPSRNPHDLSHMSGGSSGGSGTAVGAGLVPLALGSDTNGSIRVPSSLCGLFGLKPSYGRLSRRGSFLFCASLDHLGPLARSPRDLALAYDAMQGADPADPVSAPVPIKASLDALDDGIGDLRIAIADDYFTQQAEPEPLEAVQVFANALGVTRRITIPEAGRARAAAFIITATEGANLHRERLRHNAADFDPDTRDRFLAGLMLPGEWYVQAQRFRSWYRSELSRLFNEVDIILAPATPCTAPKLGQKTMMLSGRELPVRANLGLFTQPISFAGLPVVCAPYNRPGQLPIGVQIIAAPWQEANALRVAARLEALGTAVSKIASSVDNHS